MSNSDHARAKALFLEAIARPPADRAAYVARACADDDGVRREVESLLAYHGDRTEPSRVTHAETQLEVRVLRHASVTPTRADRSQATYLVARAARRLQIVCLVVLSSVLVLWAGVNLAQGEFRDEFVFPSQWLPPVLIVLASVAMWRVARRPVPAAPLLRSGLAYQVVVSAAIAVTQYAGAFRGVRPIAMNTDLVGLSHVATWTLFFTVLVPARPTEALVALVASNAMVPLTYWHEMSTGMAPVLDAVTFSSLFIWPYVAVVGGAYVAARIVHQLGVEVHAAQDLGAYRLEALLGRGGMGEVWRASHHTLARPVAVKVIRRDLLGHDPVRAAAALARFEAEAQAIASLQSPHTVELYDFGRTDDGTAFAVMELLDGVDLDALVRRHGPLPAHRVVRILRQVCASLAEAHHGGLVHRDIKPANIYLCRRGLEQDVVKVLDFGLVTAFSGNSGEARGPVAVIGTPDYMAPETTAPDGCVDGRTDLYGLGGVGFWLLTGRLVFPRDSTAERLQAHREAAPDPPSLHAPWPVPAELDALILACLAKTPEQRPPSAEDVARQLDRIVETSATA